jgi:hypothetical protein
MAARQDGGRSRRRLQRPASFGCILACERVMTPACAVAINPAMPSVIAEVGKPRARRFPSVNLFHLLGEQTT